MATERNAQGVDGLAGALRITRTEYSTGITTTIHEAVMHQPAGTYWIVSDEARAAVAELVEAVRPHVAMDGYDANAADLRGESRTTIYCRFDVLNPCFDPDRGGWSKEHGPGLHWAGGSACPDCRLRAALLPFQTEAQS